MNIRIREQAGTDSVRKFDYQMAVALDYLLSEIDSDTIILIETLEDFAVFRNHGTEFEEIEIIDIESLPMDDSANPKLLCKHDYSAYSKEISEMINS